MDRWLSEGRVCFGHCESPAPKTSSPSSVAPECLVLVCLLEVTAFHCHRKNSLFISAPEPFAS